MFPNMVESYVYAMYISMYFVSLYVHADMHIFSLSLDPIIERFRYKPKEREAETGG